jgi:hypothetical protein
MKYLLYWSCFLLPLSYIDAQPLVEADTAAVHSIDDIVKEATRLVCSAEGKTRNLAAYRDLFLPTARFTVLYHGDAMPMPSESVSLEEFLEYLEDPYYDDNYFEYETGKVINEYNGIANVFQSFRATDRDGVDARGVNSYQLIYINDRWWISDVLWTSNDNGVPIPERYLGH